MKLEKINKYARKKTIGIGSVIISMTLLMSACGLTSAKEEVHAEEPTSIVATVTPTATPEPTIKPTPVPTNTPVPTLVPMVKLEGEELEKAIDELCIEDKNTVNEFGYYSFCAFITKTGEKKIMIVYCGVKSNDGDKMTIFDTFTNEELFNFEPIDMYACIEEPTKDITSINPLFEDAEVIALDIIPLMLHYCDYFGIEINWDMAWECYPKEGELENIHFTNSEMGELYVNLVPEAFRVKASDLNKEYAIEETPKVKEIG